MPQNNATRSKEKPFVLGDRMRVRIEVPVGEEDKVVVEGLNKDGEFDESSDSAR